MVYRIDSNDAIVHTDGAFERFATAVGEPELPERVMGDPLWSFIGDPELCALHVALVERARSGRTITVRSRCDTPSLARSIDITFTPLADGEVEIACRLARAELLGLSTTPEGTIDRDDMLRLCAWCHRAERDGWRDLEEVVVEERLLEQSHVPRVTHGICDACLAEVGADYVGSGGDARQPVGASR